VRNVKTALALVATLVIASIAAGCGSDNSDKQANETYANGVCTAIGEWGQQVKTIATTFNGSLSKAGLESKLDEAASATRTLARKIKAVPAPDTSDGRAAKQQLDQLLTDVDKTIDAAQTAAANLPADASVATIGGAIASLAPQVQALAAEAKSAASSLKEAGGSLADAFKKSDSCQSLGSS
jgi:hypothetical protein